MRLNLEKDFLEIFHVLLLQADLLDLWFEMLECRISLAEIVLLDHFV